MATQRIWILIKNTFLPSIRSDFSLYCSIDHFKITIRTKTLGKGVCRCMSAEHGDNELELGPDDVLVDGLIKKGIKDQSQLEVAIGDGMEFTIHGDIKGKKGKTLLNNAKVSLHLPLIQTTGFKIKFVFLFLFKRKQLIGNSINHQDNRLEHELNHRGMSLQDDDTASIKSYGSHKNRPFKDESHKGSAETLEGEEKRDVSKEDLGIDEGLTKLHLFDCIRLH